MKKALIIEDEQIAVQNLRRRLAEVSADIEVVAVLQSIEESVEYFSEQPMPDICFMDIHLADGLAFRIFDKVTVDCPIIFTTAYDQYALDAFKVNSIDYLLKPIDKDDLQRALTKAERLVGHADDGRLDKLLEAFGRQYRIYKSYFLIPVRDKLVPLQVDDIACFYLENKLSRALTYEGDAYAIDKPLDILTEQLDPDRFFRANRQYLISRRAVKEILVWPLGKLAVTLRVKTPERIILSKARTREFKEWFTR